MFGPKLNTLFKSRWNAALWAMGILLTAYCTVPVAEQARRHEAAKMAAAKPHKSPWAY